MKVYCEDCKWYKGHWVSSNYAYTLKKIPNCEYPKNILIESLPSNKRRVLDRSYEDINIHNNCSWYKRKWWKFWVER